MHNPTTRNIARRATTTALLVLVVIVGGRAVCGPWPTAIVVAAAGTCWGLRAWSRIESRTSPGPAAPGVEVARPVVGHVAFARALAAVAAAYLTECERAARS
jgi:hypothetical protein